VLFIDYFSRLIGKIFVFSKGINLLYPEFLLKDNPKSYAMPRMIYDYTKSVLERVSFDPTLFKKELRKALKALLPYELEQLKKWLEYFTTTRPELKSCISVIE
jgi:hypothetical protein